MPKLVPYESQEAVRGLDVQPLNQGAERLEQAGRFISTEGERQMQADRQLGGYLGQASENVKKYQNSQALIHGTSLMMQQEMQQDQEWEAMLKNGDALDPAKRDAFNQRWNDQRASFIDGLPVDVQPHFAELNGRLQMENFTRRTAELSNVSAEADIGAVKTTLQQAEAMAMNGGVAGVRRGMMLINSLSEGFKNDPNLKAEGQSKLQEFIDTQARPQLIKAAGVSLALNDPSPDKAFAIQQIKDNFGPGTDFFPGTEIYQQLINGAKGAAAMQQSALTQKRMNDDRIARSNYNQAATDLILKPPTDAAGNFDPLAYSKRIMHLGAIQTPDGNHIMTQGEALEWQHYGEYLSNGMQRATSEGTFDTLVQHMAAGEMPSRQTVLQLMSSTQGPHLDRGAGEFLLGQIAKGANSDEPKMIAAGVKTAASELFQQIYGPKGPPGMYTPGGDAAVSAFKTWFYPELRRQLAAGHTLDELIDPKSPLSLVSPDRVKQFVRTDDDIMKAATGTTQGASPVAPKPLTIHVGEPPEGAAP